MKYLLYCLSLVALAAPVSGQITISNSDMPSVGDTFRVSNGLVTPAIDPVPTGAAYTWDFSMLQPVSQQVDTFVDVASTGPIYSLVFLNVPFNPNRANLAAKGPAFPAIPQLAISDVNYFYYNSTQAYELSGYGALINSLPVPIPFNNKDRIYDFPVQFGNADSSDSDFQVSLATLGYYGHDQHRVNNADGYGTLITPYGTFDALRVKSVITGTDSLYLDTLGFGFSLPLPQTTEYKWLGTQQGIPLLQINTTLAPGGIEVVSSIVYRDSLRNLTGLIENNSGEGPDFSVFPNPSPSDVTVRIYAERKEHARISLFSAAGAFLEQLWVGDLLPGTNLVALPGAGSRFSNGVYLIELKTGTGQRSVRQFTLNR